MVLIATVAIKRKYMFSIYPAKDIQDKNKEIDVTSNTIGKKIKNNCPLLFIKN
jgi:hypothetical protein